MRYALIGLGALALVGCSTAQGLTTAQLSEKAETDAELAYVGIATSLNAVEATYPAKAAAAEDIKRKAWAALLTVRQAYAAGRAVNTSIMANFANQAAALNAPGGQ